MTTKFDRYGWVDTDLDEVRASVSLRLNLAFEQHWSDEWGGQCWSTGLSTMPSADLVRNFEDEDGVLLEDTRPELTVVLDSTGLTQDQCDILESLGGQLLNSSVI